MSLKHDELGRELSAKDRDYFSWSKDSNNRVSRRVVGEVKDVAPFGAFDEIQTTYPSATTEVYTYKFNTVAIGTVTVTYIASNKSDLQSVVYNAI